MSNIRWDGDWMKISPTHFSKVFRSPDQWYPTTVDIVIIRTGEWQFFVNRNYIASFNTWEEASQAAPMLYQLHKDTQ